MSSQAKLWGLPARELYGVCMEKDIAFTNCMQGHLASGSQTPSARQSSGYGKYAPASAGGVADQGDHVAL